MTKSRSKQGEGARRITGKAIPTEKLSITPRQGGASRRRYVPAPSIITLVIDTGQDIVGIFCVEDGTYLPYRGAEITSAIRRIEAADEVVTYNGKDRDLLDLARFAGRRCKLKGVHTDMRSICWSDEIWGSSLRSTYSQHFSDCPRFPDTYEGCNEADVYQTFKLWELWKQGKLRTATALPQLAGNVHQGAKDPDAR